MDSKSEPYSYKNFKNSLKQNNSKVLNPKQSKLLKEETIEEITNELDETVKNNSSTKEKYDKSSEKPEEKSTEKYEKQLSQKNLNKQLSKVSQASSEKKGRSEKHTSPDKQASIDNNSVKSVISNIMKIPSEKYCTDNKVIFIFKNEKNNINFYLKEIIDLCPILNMYNKPIESNIKVNKIT